MRLLLDTPLLIWTAANSPRLSPKARNLIGDVANQCLFSVASLWEIAIKTALGRDEFAVDAADLRAELLANDHAELPIQASHALYTVKLPWLHKDPFDRLLAAQALEEDLILITGDKMVASYSPSFIRV